MVTKVRSTAISSDTRLWGSFPDTNSTWSSIGGGVSLTTSTVTADYPKRDWRKVILLGDNATTTMSASRNGYVLGPLKINSRGRIDNIPWILSGSLEDTYHEVLAWVLSNQGVKSSFTTTRVRGLNWANSLQLETDPNLFNKVDNQALMGFNKQVLKAQRDFQGLVFAGELGESLRMIRRPADTFRKGVYEYYEALRKRLKRRHIRYNPASVRDILSGTWLEYSYGWKPLLSDTYDGAKALANALYRQPDRTFVSFTASGETTKPGNSLVTWNYSNSAGGKRREVRKHYCSIKYYGIVGMPSSSGFTAARFGTTFGDFFPTIWELTPYSFLVDYFTNVGEVLSAFSTASSGVKWVARGTESIAYSYWSEIFRSIPSPSDVPVKRRYLEVSWRPGARCSLVNRSISRDTYYGTMLPSFEFTLPGSSSTKWLNIAALIASRRKLSDLFRS